MAARESQHRIRMMPSIGEPDPQRLVQLVREYVKRNSPPISELQHDEVASRLNASEDSGNEINPAADVAAANLNRWLIDPAERHSHDDRAVSTDVSSRFLASSSCGKKNSEGILWSRSIALSP